MTRSGRVVVLVDGSNVARSEAWAAAIERERGEVPHANHHLDSDPRARLLDWILYWTTSSGVDIVAVFDGEGPLGAGRTQWNHGYLVIGSGSVDGDRVIEQEARRLQAEGASVRLVTDDHALADVAGAHAEVVHAVAHFVGELSVEPHAELGADPGGMGGADRHAQGSRLADAVVDEDVLTRLERLRRGE